MSFLPEEFKEFNWRLWSFIILLILAMTVLLIFPFKRFEGYLDPFYSPTIFLLPIPALLRITCYAYRKDYNRHIFRHPNYCPLVEREISEKYSGENSGLFKFLNLHRYFAYLSILILPFFFFDFFTSLFYNGIFLLRLGSLLLLINAIFLTFYVFSCHSIRNLIGGKKNCYSCTKVGRSRKKIYNVQSLINKHHEQIAWISLVFIIFIDLYLRALSGGWHIDFTFFSMVIK